MRKARMLILAAMLVAGMAARAADGERFVTLTGGVLYPRVMDLTLSFEKETRYHNAWELYGEFASQWRVCPDCGKVCRDSFWNYRRGLSFGMAYKAAFWRTRNAVGRVRAASDVGTFNRGFALGVELGLEYAVTVRGGLQLLLQQRNEISFWAKPTFRNGVAVGIRLPLSR